MTEQERGELIELRRCIESDAFQKWIAKPMREYRNEQRNDFFSADMKESWRKGGRVEGVEKFLMLIKIIDETVKNN